jgi:hypothetical protein
VTQATVGCAGHESLWCTATRASSIQRPPFGHCSFGVSRYSKIEVCVKISEVVVGRNSSASDAQVIVRGFLAAKSHMNVVKSVKRKPLEYWSLRWVELPSCRSSRKPEWHRL